MMSLILILVFIIIVISVVCLNVLWVAGVIDNIKYFGLPRGFVDIVTTIGLSLLVIICDILAGILLYTVFNSGLSSLMIL